MLANGVRQFLVLKPYSPLLFPAFSKLLLKLIMGKLGVRREKNKELGTAGGNLKLEIQMHYLRHSLYGPIKLRLFPRVIKILL